MGKQSDKLVALALSGFLLLNLGGWGTAQAAGPKTDTEHEVIVVYKNGEGKEAVLDQSIRVQHEFESVPAVSATVTSNDLYGLTKNPDIAYIEQNITFRTTHGELRTASLRSEQSEWSFQAVQPVNMWDKGYTGRGVKVAVIDSGISAHDELSIAGGISTVDYTTSYSDDEGHGTHVAGIIAAHNNGYGIAGIAPDVQLYAIKAMGRDGKGSLQDLLEGLDWAIQNRMDIINMSLVSDADSQLLHEMVDQAYAAGMTIVGSAGNSQTDQAGNPIPTDIHTINYPAKYDSVIAVAAVDSMNQRAAFSSVGSEVEVAAPGVDVISTYVQPDGTAIYAKASGTSQAAPHVTGMLALLKQQYPGMSNAQLRKEVRKFAVDIGAPGRDIEFGYGSLTFSKEVSSQENVTNLHKVENMTFTDVKAGAWYEPTVNWGSSLGLIKGYRDQKFKPNQTVTEAEFLAMLFRAFEPGIPSLPGSHWTEGYYKRARELNYPVKSYTNPAYREKIILRQQVAELISSTDGVHYRGNYAIEYVLATGLAKGTKSKQISIASFQGGKALTRAESLQFVKNLYDHGIDGLQKRPLRAGSPSDIPPLQP